MYRNSATIDPPLRGSSWTRGVTDDLSTSKGRKDGGTIWGAVLPDALTATVTSTASHAATVSGACATIASCAMRMKPITSLSLPAVARHASASASSPGRRAPRAPRFRGADRPAADRVHRRAEAVVAAAMNSIDHHPRHRHHRPPPAASYEAGARKY